MKGKLAVALCPLLFGVSTASLAAGNLIRNGDFELNGATAGVSQANLSNAAFSALVDFSTAFGTSLGGDGELDLFTTDASYLTPPQSGSWQVGLHGDGVTYDAFSLQLSSPVVSGNEYRLSFYVAAPIGMHPNGMVSVQIGISADSASLGSAVYTSNMLFGSGGWQAHDVAFVAPTSGSYLTVRNVSVYTVVDNFTLAPVPEPETYAMLALGLGLLGLRARHSSRKSATMA